MTTVRVPIQRELRGGYVTPRAVSAFREMLQLAELCSACGPILPTYCECSHARRDRWLTLDGIIYQETPDRRPWELTQMCLPPSFPADDRWTARAVERWRMLEAAVKADAAGAQVTIIPLP